MDVVRIGVIGTANTHAAQYIGLLNGWSSDVPFPERLPDGRPSGVMHQCFGTHLREASRLFPEHVMFHGARVTRLWSEDGEDADLIGQACRVEVVNTPDDAANDVDAVMVLTEDPQCHLAHSTTGLRAGLPTYIDKPLAANEEDAHAISELAELNGTPWYSCSSLRWAPGLQDICQSITGYGGAQSIYVQCPARASNYAIHAVEVMGAVMRSFSATEISAVSTSKKDVVVLDLDDGRSATLENNGAVERMSYCALIQSRLREHVWIEKDFGMMNVRFLRSFIEFVTTGHAPVSSAECLASFALTQRIQSKLGETV